MSRSARPRPPSAPPGRTPHEQAGGPTPPDRPDRDWGASLQLGIARDGVGLEISAPIELGPLRVTEARARLVGVRFPVDVSGGVERFRHRRTELERATLRVDLQRLERWLATHVADLVAPGAADVRVTLARRPREARGAHDPEDTAESPPRSGTDVRVDVFPSGEPGALLSFALAIAASGAGVVAIAHDACAVAFDGSPTAAAGRFLARIAVPLRGRAQGVRLVVPDVTRGALVDAFVSRGARLPERRALVVSSIASTGASGPPSSSVPSVPSSSSIEAQTDRADAVELRVRQGGVPAAPSSRFAALDEIDRLISDGDVALVRGDGEQARDIYLRALERAPRHPVVLTRLAEVDSSATGRSEAALAWAREASRKGRRPAEAPDAGGSPRGALPLARLLLEARLYERVGAFGRARGAYDRAGELAEASGNARLAARCYSRAAATLAEDDPQLLPTLDRALSANPSELEARWRRARARILVADDERALEDVQHLEAQARGREARRRVLVRAAALWASVGRSDRAVPAFERALRYAPDDRVTVAGLGRSLVAAGEVGRGVTLLAQALDLPGDEPTRVSTLLELARALAEHVGDRPAAIARLREVGDDSRRTALARSLEGFYREEVGDRPGAERAWATAAEACERREIPADDAERVSSELRRAAHVVREDDVSLAHRFALAALGATPRSRPLVELARMLGREVAARAPTPPASLEGPTLEEPAPERSDEDIGAPLAVSLDDTDDARAGDDDALVAKESRAEALLARVKANPDDDAAVDELVDLLAELGRDFELFALLSARYDEAPAELRVVLAPKQRAVLGRLAETARARGREMEAALYAEAARGLG